MISTLHIKNIGIIDDLTINLNEGFNVFTGETGAGKTLIIDSLQILAGGRFSKEMIRNGEEYSFVEMSLYLKNFESNDEENIIISREINISGRNICKINGRLVTVNDLKEFMTNIIDIHGQQDNQLILDSSSHIIFLDDFIGNKIGNIKNEYRNKYKEFLNMSIELRDNYGDDKEKERKLDLLKYQLNEIDEASLTYGEEDIIENKLKKLLNAEKISDNLNQSAYDIEENILNSLDNSIRLLDKIENFDEKYKDAIQRARSCYYELEELGRDLNEYKSEIECDEEERKKLELRLDLIQDLKRKYGNNIDEILDYRNKIEKEIYEIENKEEYISKLKSDIEILRKEMKELSNNMSVLRIEGAKQLSEKINIELKDLEMKNANFKVNIEKTEEFNSNGLDKVEFLINTNIGETHKPLTKIASGGEMSRIMLGIKTVLADVDKVPVLIFDEIDTGISGIAAKKVGEKMKEISKKHQVICVTHLATIAAKGDYNYMITKLTDNNKTKTNVKLLNENEVLEEIARISSGEVTEISLKHAKELRKEKVA